MSLVWWKNPRDPLGKAAALPSAGKFADISRTTVTASAKEKEFSLVPLASVAAAAIAIFWGMSTRGLIFTLFEFRIIANLAMISVIASAVVLFQRYSISHENRRLYLALTFAMTAVSIVLYMLIIPLLHAKEDAIELVVQLRVWGSYSVRIIFAFLLTVALMAEQSKKRDMHINVGWFATVSLILIGLFYGMLAFFDLPPRFALGSITHFEEIVPLALYLVAAGFIIKKQFWRTDKLLYHLLIVITCEIVGTSALLLSPSAAHILQIMGYAFILLGVAFPFFSIQTSMYRSYRYAEQHRIQENWMTRTGSGTKGGLELSPTVFRKIAQQINEAIAITDVSGRIMFANNFLMAMIGKHDEDIMNKLPSAWQHRSMAPDFYTRIFARIQKDKIAFEGKVKNAYPNNPERGYDVSVSVTPVLNEFGDIACCVLRQKDVSVEQERAHFLRQMIDTMSLGVMIVDVPSLRISLINTQAEYLLSSSGLNIRMIRTLEDLVPNLQTVKRTPYKSEALPFHATVRQKRSTEADDIAVFLEQSSSPVMVWKMKATPFFHEDGTIHSMLISFDDISRHREYEHKMSDFISVASHQLRTPLTSIKWTLDTLRRTESKLSDVDTKEMFDTCYQASERMMLTIQQLLHVAELEGGNITVKMEKVDFTEVVVESLKTLKLLMDKKKIGFKQSVLRTLPPLHYNKFFLNQIVQNLLENAVKYSNENGEIDSILTVKGDYIEWTLHDSGVGITQESLGHLFEKFFRGDNAQRANPDGTGLGLFIVKSTLDASGGSISIESEEGKGTTVYAKIPIVQESKERKLDYSSL